MDGAADVAETLGYACVHRHELRCEGLLANAGCAWMMLRAGAVVRGAVAGDQWGLRAATRSRAAAVRAGNQIGDDGAASLAPSLRWMTQLTSLDLNSTLVCIGSVGLRCGLGRLFAGL